MLTTPSLVLPYSHNPGLGHFGVQYARAMGMRIIGKYPHIKYT
jgi:hypothetical protein